jgi:amino acid transporter
MTYLIKELVPARVRRLLFGAPRDPMKRETRQSMALIAFLAWVGLGADGLSSANYGPEEGFLALGAHSHLALYLAAATAITVFVIGFAYNQVIELFPSGGGGYKVATVLIGPFAGLVSGSALIVDYILTIAISIAAAVDALFSLLPLGFQIIKLPTAVVLTILLTFLNLRGIKESLRFLVPLFIGFILTHGGLIVYGILDHASALPTLIPATIAESRDMIGEVGWWIFLSTLLFSFAMGGGTYTGIEAVSNNVNLLREPRVKTGRLTMVYMATSLAFTAGGLIVLYLLWDVDPAEGRTLNAQVFELILADIFGANSGILDVVMLVTLAFAASLLFVAANTGFLGGPAVLANMAADRWVPHQFSQLSSRLVTQNGVLLMSGAAIAALLLTNGTVHVLVLLYSINVFLTFAVCLFGLCLHWWRNRREPSAVRHFFLAGFGFSVASGILLVTLYEKFAHGVWMSVLFTGLLATIGLLIRRHYDSAARELAKIDALFATATPPVPLEKTPQIDPSQSTAVFLIGTSLGAGMHTLLTALKLFPQQFRNFVFLSVGEVDTESFRGQEMLDQLRRDVDHILGNCVNYCQHRNMAATSFQGFGADTVVALDELCAQVTAEFPNSVFFASKQLFEKETIFTRFLHNQTVFAIQRRLHLRGVPMVILPMKI